MSFIIDIQFTHPVYGCPAYDCLFYEGVEFNPYILNARLRDRGIDPAKARLTVIPVIDHFILGMEVVVE